MTCIDENVLAAYARRGIQGADATRIDEHLDACQDCRRLVFALATAPETTGTSGVAAGDRLGRYIVGEAIGEGGMGTVFAGQDPELNRKVALKVLKGAPTPEGQARLVREARALAQLSHPNIVSVFDVGRSGDEVFLAMELLDGRDMERWLGEGDRSWKDVIAVFLEVGKGLAAAHEVGIVHRDLKPQNMFIERDGRVCVTDFGLARQDEAALARSGAAPVTSTFTPEHHNSLTHGLIGTPAYLAPEQHERGTVDAGSDQFSFCVSLYQALYGERPFRADTLEDLRARMLEGRVAPPPRGRRVPTWLRRVVLRGLSAAPQARFPSMAALLAAMSRDPWVMRRRVLLAAAAFALIASLVLVVSRRADAPDLRCKGAERKFVGTWDASQKQMVHKVFAATSASYAEDAWRAVERALDAYASRWAATRTEACEATQIRGEQSDELLDLRMQCLDYQLIELQALVGVLSKADTDIVQKAVQLAQSLPDTAWCSDVDALKSAGGLPADPAMRQQVDAIMRDLARVGVLREGKPAQALELAKKLAEQSAKVGFPPLEAEALAALGAAQGTMGDPKTAGSTLREAALRADAARLDPLRATALTALAAATSALASYDEGREIGRAAAAVIARLPRRDDLRAQLENVQGGTERGAGRYDEARTHFETSLALWGKIKGPNNVGSAKNLYSLASVEYDRNHNDEAGRYVHRALETYELTVGPAHPAFAKTLSLLGDIQWHSGQLDDAIATHRRAVSIAQVALGADHADMAWLLNNLGGVLDERGDFDESIRIQQRAVDVFQKAFGPGHPDTAMALNGLGQIAFKKGDIEAALSHGLAALAIREKVLGPDHPRVGYDLALVSAAYLRLDQPAKAIDSLQRTLAMRLKRDGESEEVAEARLMLAEAMWNAGSDHPRALQLARQAREFLKSLGHPPMSPNLVNDVESFFAEVAAHK